MKIKIELEWLNFLVDLPSLEEKMKQDHGSNYMGNQAHSVLELYFKEGYLSDNEIQDLKLWFKQDLDESEEAEKRSRPSRDIDQKKSIINSEKEAIAQVSDFSSLTQLQKKIWLGLELTNDEIDSLAE